MPLDTSVPHLRGPHPLPLLLALAWRVTGGETDAMARFLEGLARYQQAPGRPPTPMGRLVARRGAVRLFDCGGPAEGPALLLVPSIINGGEVLDLLPGRSLVEGLRARGCRVWRIDWGGLDRGEQRLGLAGLVSARLAPLASEVPGPFTLAGHCLGGTLAVGLAALLPERVSTLVLLAAPWRFSGYGQGAAGRARQAWRRLAPLARSLGGLPLMALNPLFWSLDEAGVVAKYQALGAGDPERDALVPFAAVEDWANSGPPLGLAALRGIFLHGLARDAMARGRWRLRGQPIRVEALKMPIIDIGARRDRLVPAAARMAAAPGIRKIEIDSGHVGMIVGRRRHLLWDMLAKVAASG
jgi:polyhydroxyalkanoate synthase